MTASQLTTPVVPAYNDGCPSFQRQLSRHTTTAVPASNDGRPSFQRRLSQLPATVVQAYNDSCLGIKERQQRCQFARKSDPALAFALANSAKHGLMEITVSAPQGKYRGGHAGRVVEVGTLGGYSTIWMARGLPKDGKLMTFELDEKTAGVAKENIAPAGLADRAEVVVGPASRSSSGLRGHGITEEGTYDFAFIDAFVVDNVTHIVNNECKRLVKSGGVINGLVDNIVQNGLVADEAKTVARTSSPGEETSYIEPGRELLEYLQADPDLEATADSRGFDGWDFVLRK
ncbi:S-adenosyl-L-methionine-dependent methyltransferase [Schizophyllum commune]